LVGCAQAWPAQLRKMPALCGVCTRSQARYTCPRCQLGYCSLECYKGHSDRCTESFYQAQVEEELRSQRATGDERRRLEQIISELSHLDENPDEEAEEEEEELEDEEEAETRRLEELVAKAERGELCLEDLTEGEAQCFHSELKRGALGQTLGVWEPWWQRAAVVEVDLDALDDGPLETSSSSRAAVPTPAHICCAGDRKAHPAVALTALEVLYAYVHTMRAFNGDWAWDPLQAALHLLHLGSSVCSRKVYSTARECLLAALASASALPGGGFGAELDELCLGDLARLLGRGGDTQIRALREAMEMIDLAAKTVNERQANNTKAIGRLQRGAKKLEFLMSFAGHHQDDLEQLVPEVSALESKRRAEAQEQEDEEGRRALGGVALPQRN